MRTKDKVWGTPHMILTLASLVSYTILIVGIHLTGLTNLLIITTIILIIMSWMVTGGMVMEHRFYHHYAMILAHNPPNHQDAWRKQLDRFDNFMIDTYYLPSYRAHIVGTGTTAKTLKQETYAAKPMGLYPWKPR
jgi:hypothetical protein